MCSYKTLPHSSATLLCGFRFWKPVRRSSQIPRLTLHWPWLPISNSAGLVSVLQSTLSHGFSSGQPSAWHTDVLKTMHVEDEGEVPKGLLEIWAYWSHVVVSVEGWKDGSVLPSLSCFQNPGCFCYHVREEPLAKTLPSASVGKSFLEKTEANILFLSVGFKLMSEKNIAVLSSHLPFCNWCFSLPTPLKFSICREKRAFSPIAFISLVDMQWHI